MNRLAARPQDRVRMIGPFALVALLPLALAPARPEGCGPHGRLRPADARRVVSIVVLPWHRLPTWLMSVPGLVYCVALLCAQEAEGGARSGLALLFLPPVMFMALRLLEEAPAAWRDQLRAGDLLAR